MLLCIVVIFAGALAVCGAFDTKSDADRLREAAQRLPDWEEAYQIARNGGNVFGEFKLRRPAVQFPALAEVEIMIDSRGEVLRGASWHVMRVRDDVPDEQVRSAGDLDTQIVGRLGSSRWWLFRQRN